MGEKNRNFDILFAHERPAITQLMPFLSNTIESLIYRLTTPNASTYTSKESK